MRSAPFACLSFLLSFFVVLSANVRGDETIVLNIIVNSVDKGIHYVKMSGPQDFYIQIRDLKDMGFADPQGPVYEIEGDRYLLLSSMKGISYHYDEKEVSLEITAAPSQFRTRIMDLNPPRPDNVYLPSDTSLYLNYALSYTTDYESFRSVDLANELGARYRGWLFLTDSISTHRQDTDQIVRLMSQGVYDNRKQFTRLIVGDYFSSPGQLSGSLNLGGISYRKIFLMDPHYIPHPTMDISGGVMFPSKMDVFMDGMLVDHTQLSPGGFDLRNLTTRNGAGLVDVVLTDPFGNVQKLSYPVYMSKTLLRKGLHEYSYDLGFLREGYGQDSFNYGDFVGAGYHRYGVSDRWTIEVGGEFTRKNEAAGASTNVQVLELGILSASFSGSRNEDHRSGLLATLGYQYQSRRFNANIDVAHFGRDYSTVSSTNLIEQRRYEFIAGMGYSVPDLGAITTNYAYINQYDYPNRQIYTIGYSRNILRNLALTTRFRWLNGEIRANEIFVGLTFFSYKDVTFSAQYDRFADTYTESVQAQKNLPVGEGVGGRLLYQSSEDTDSVEGAIQVNDRYGTYSGQYRTFDSAKLLEVSAAGAIVSVGKTVGLTRPVTDSFGLVEVENIEGVTAYRNGQEIGKTDSNGRVFIPDMNSFYDNQIFINDRDIPIQYSISDITRLVSPPYRSGSLIRFGVEKLQAVTGRVGLTAEGQFQPLEFIEIRMDGADKKTVFQTGRGGEFYVENVGPGTHKAFAEIEDKPCSFDIIVPTVEDALIELGDLTCVPTR